MANTLFATESPPTKVTRVRPQLSCIPCRQGKLKCNRAHPACDQCVKRSRESACSYVPPPPKDRGRKAKDMRGRIRHLESLVVDLMNGKDPRGLSLKPDDPVAAAPRLPASEHASPEYHSASDGPKTHSSSGDDVPRCASAFGALRISDAETTYTGGSHWTAVLHDISEVKSILDSSEDDEEEPERPRSQVDGEALRRFTLVVGSPPPVTRRDLLSNLPPKSEVDRLVTLWHNSQDPTSFIFHPPTFQAEYQQFWANPSETPTMWIGLLYGILSLATVYGLRTELTGPTAQSPASTLKQAAKYRSLAASATVLADFAKAKPYTLETLLIYVSTQYLSAAGSETEVWYVFGIIVRSALRMGYHRDPSHYGNISPFHGEMRRRVWHVIYQLDILLSFALGLPCTVRGFQSDTKVPRNLHDSDLTVDMPDLPPERPVTEYTPVSYAIAKFRLISIFATAADASHAVTPPTYPEIMELDHRLREAHALIPPHLTARPLDQQIADSPEIIMNRFNMDLLHQKTRCVLHRTYLVKAHSDSRYEHSRQTCLDAAMILMRQQEDIYRACQPGGQLSRVRWYFSSLTSQDFLLAAMIVCLEMNLRHEAKRDPGIVEPGPFTSEDLFKAMENSSKIWDSYEASLIDAADAKRAAKVFRQILAKLKSKSMPPESAAKHTSNEPATEAYTGLPAQFNPPPIVPSADPGTAFMHRAPSHSVPVDHPNGVVAYGMVNPDPLGEMLDMPLDINWETWDKNVVSYDVFMDQQQWTMPPPNIDSSAFPEPFHPDMSYNYQH